MLLEARREFLVRGHRSRRTVHDDEVDAVQFCLVMPEGFPDHSLDAIACGCLPAVLLGDRETEPGGRVLRAPGEYRKAFVAASPSFFEDTIERGSVSKPLVFTKGIAACRYQRATT